MMNSAELRAAMDLLLHAARGSERRFLVGVGNSGERARIARALLGEGAVV